jgi:hypothetical protein
LIRGGFAGAAIRADVIAGHSRPKDGVASLAYDPAIHLLCEKLDHRVTAP